MLAKNIAKIDRFYGFLILALLFLTILVIFSSKEIFYALITANEIDQKSIGPPLQVNKENLNKAYELIFNQKIISLDSGL